MNYDFFIYRHAWRYNLAPDCEPELSDAQFKELLCQGGRFVRNTFDFDCKEKTDFWYVIKDSFGGMEEHTSNERRKIRRALNAFDYRLIDIAVLRNQGYPIIKETFEDYKVKDRPMTKAVFTDYLDYCSENRFNYWGVFNKDNQELIGFCTVHVWDNSCEYGISGIVTEYKRNSTYPYYGLYFKMNEYYLDEKKFDYVTDSARSITEHSNIQPFLEQNFKFRKAYCKLKIKYKWWFGAIVRLLLPFRKLIRNRNVRAVLNMHLMQSSVRAKRNKMERNG